MQLKCQVNSHSDRINFDGRSEREFHKPTTIDTTSAYFQGGGEEVIT